LERGVELRAVVIMSDVEKAEDGGVADVGSETNDCDMGEGDTGALIADKARAQLEKNQVQVKLISSVLLKIGRAFVISDGGRRCRW
jgi:hypothetical protein